MTWGHGISVAPRLRCDVGAVEVRRSRNCSSAAACAGSPNEWVWAFVAAPAMRIPDATYLKSAPVPPTGPRRRSPRAGLLWSQQCRQVLPAQRALGPRLARPSVADAGRTRLINFSRPLQRQWRQPRRASVRRPAGLWLRRSGRSERQLWRGMIEEYFTDRQALSAVVLLFDARRLEDGEQRASTLLFDELELANYLQSLGRPVIPVVTKSDKLSKNERKPAAAVLTRLLRIEPVILSAHSGEGMDDLWKRIFRILQPRPVQVRGSSAASESPLPPPAVDPANR